MATVVTAGCNDASEEKSSTCGNGVVESDEVCDGATGVPAQCSAIDNTRNWLKGRPACSSDCMSVTMGSCVYEDKTPGRSNCGNGVIDAPEVCDGEAGVPATCQAFDPSKMWKEGGAPKCSSDCLSVVPGSCVQNTCGNARLDEGEVCDKGVLNDLKCSDLDGDTPRAWKAGGSPVCNDECSGWDMSLCVETAICGDGILSVSQDASFESERCDGKLGVPDSCAAYRNDIVWKDGGSPACNGDCTALTQGSCTPANAVLTFMNWNILFEYENNGGKDPVIDRARRWHDIVSGYEVKPDFMNLLESSPQWHTQEVTALFEDAGYVWADNEVCTVCSGNPDGQRAPLSNVIYLKDKFQLLDHGHVSFFNADGVTYQNPDKTIVFYAVLQEKTSGEVFVSMSSHWEANNLKNGTQTDDWANIVGDIVEHENNRLYGVKQSIDVLRQLRAKYPDAHYLYAGDFNTIDLDIPMGSPFITAISGASTKAELVQFINNIVPEGRMTLPENTEGSHDDMERLSGLTDARSLALSASLISPNEDLSTTSGEPASIAIRSLLASVNIKIILDYALYSANNLTLMSYQVVTGEDYEYVSDHYPVLTTYVYVVK